MIIVIKNGGDISPLRRACKGYLTVCGSPAEEKHTPGFHKRSLCAAKRPVLFLEQQNGFPRTQTSLAQARLNPLTFAGAHDEASNGELMTSVGYIIVALLLTD